MAVDRQKNRKKMVAQPIGVLKGDLDKQREKLGRLRLLVGVRNNGEAGNFTACR